MKILGLVLISVLLADVPVFTEEGLSILGEDIVTQTEEKQETTQSKKEKIAASENVEEQQDDTPEEKDIFQKNEAQGIEPQLELMRKYQDKIANKEKEIEMLNLDFKKTKLILERKQLESKINEINQQLQDKGTRVEIGQLNNLLDENTSPQEEEILPDDIKISLIVISENVREAILLKQGLLYRVKEGDRILPQLSVKEILPDGVLLVSQSGDEIKVGFPIATK